MPLVNKTFDQLLDFTRTSSATFVGSNGLIQNTSASRNLFTFTQQFDNAAWTKTAATVTANSTVAPDGTSTADTITEDTTAASTHRVFRSFGVTTTAHTASVYLKAGTRSWGYIRLTDSGGVERFAYFNLSTGALGTVQTNLTASITDAGNGWYRCVATISASFSTGTTVFGIANADGGATYNGDGTGSLFIWGAQLEVVPAANLVLGSELVTNGTFAGGSTTGWTTGGSATISGTGDVLTVTNGATAFGFAVASITTIVGRTYYVTYQVTGGTSTGNLYIGTASGGFDNYAGPNQGVGSYAVSFVATATTTFLRLGNSVNTSGATFIVDNISTKEITAITGMPSTYTRNNGGVFPPRFDYDPVTLAPKGLLVEEQRTNLLTYSNTFTNGIWIKPDATLTTGISDPAGGTSATTLTATAAFGTAQQAIIGTAGTYSASIWIKRRTGTGQVNLRCGDLTPLIPITVTSSWVRYTVTAAATTTTLRLAVVLTTSGDEVDIYGAQLEAGAFATSYIPTVASQVTRTADQCSIVAPNFAPWFNAAEGTFVFSGDSAYGSGGFVGSTPTTGAILYANSNAPRTFNGTNFVGTANTYTNNTVFSTALGYSASGRAIVLNGGTVASDANLIQTPTAITLGGAFGGGYINGHIRSIRYYPTRLSNSQLQALTA